MTTGTQKQSDDEAKRLRKNEVQRAYRARHAERIRAKDRARAKTRVRTPKTPIKNRQYKLKQLYGLTLEEYGAMLSKQNNCCAICGTDTPMGKGRTFQVDHCHDTGRVRGLLCHDCNTGIGKLKDSPSLLAKAITYLK